MTADARPPSPPLTNDAARPASDYETLYRRAVTAEHERDERLAMLAHELRNPLNALQASVEVLNRAAPGSREAVSARDIIGRQVGKLARLIDSNLPAIASSGANPAPAESATRALRCGVIDDNHDARFGLCALLELDGHLVLTAEDGPDGLAMLIREAPEVAIVDIGLPGFDGYEVARRGREAGYAGRLIALSGYGNSDDVERSLAAGFEAHLVKPVDPETLTRLLQR